jgi:hypothetical protein
MRFNINQFEQILDERILRKGLSYYVNGKVLLIGANAANEFHFLSNGTDIVVTRSRNTIVSWQCACGRSPCAHLASALFWWQHETLGLTANSTGSRKNRLPSASRPKAKQDLYLAYRRVFSEAITTSGKGHSERRLAERLEKIKLKPGLGTEEKFALQLVVITELGLLKAKYNTGNGNVDKALQKAFRYVDQKFRKGLSDQMSDNLWRAGLRALNNRHLFGDGTAYFLLSRWMVAGGPVMAPVLFAKLMKKKPRTSTNSINWAQVMKCQLASLFGDGLGGDGPVLQSDEYAIAVSEIAFLKGDHKKGFSVLESWYKKRAVAGFPAGLCEHLILKARELKNADHEKKYLEARMVGGIYIAPQDFKRWKMLGQNELFEPEISRLIQKIRSRAQPFSEDKLFFLMLESGKLTELFAMLRKKKGVFRMFHQLAIARSGPAEELVSAEYVMQLLDALSRPVTLLHQKKIMETADEYLATLNPRKKMEIITRLYDEWRGKQFGGWLAERYGLES